ncbi:MAG: hypothetical protein K8S94_04090 [Planctomycetia bacterium]|nr:hypothetical protein [Planctomycetia bacterium]
MASKFGALTLTTALVLAFSTTAEARPRRPSAAQIKKLKETMAFTQLETLRVQAEVAAKQREVYLSFDADGDHHLRGVEKAKFDKFWDDVQRGKAASPYASIAPLGHGPKHGSQLERLEAEITRVRNEVAAKEREIFLSFDTDGDGQLKGVEKAKYDKYVSEVKSGKADNPLAGIAPVGTSPDASSTAVKK